MVFERKIMQKKVGGQKLSFHWDQQEFAFFSVEKILATKVKIGPLKLLL